MRIPQVLKQLILVCALSSPVSAQLQVLRQWQASPVLLQSVEFSPDGQQLLTASGGGIGQLWSLDGRPGPVFKGQRPPMFRAHFSSDGATLLTTGYDGSVRLWSTDGALRKALQFHRAATADARFLTQPPGYVSSSDDGTVVIRDLAGQATWSSQFIGTVRQLVVSPSGSLIVATSDDGQIHFINMNTASTPPQVSSVQTPHGRINRVVFSPSGDQLAVAGVDGSASVWTLLGQRLNTVAASTRGWSRGAVFCDGYPSLLYTIGDDGFVRSWTSSGTLVDSLRLSPATSLTSLDCSRFGRHLAVTGSNGHVWLLSPTASK